MPRKKSISTTAQATANRKQLAATQAQFKKLESRLAALDKEYAAVQAATGQLVAGLLKGCQLSPYSRPRSRLIGYQAVFAR